MFKVSMDKRIDLILGLIYCTAKRHSKELLWASNNNKEYVNEFYKLYEDNRTLDFDKYILSGGLGSGISSVSLALNLDDNYNISNASKLSLEDKNINVELAQRYIKDFVTKSDYESFVLKNKELLDNTCLKYKASINKYVEFSPEMLENFFGYKIGQTNVILINFSNENYYYSPDKKESIVINSYIIDDNTKKIISDDLLISKMFYSFAHFYVNGLGNKFFANLNMNNLYKYSVEHGVNVANSVTLINEYVCKAIEVILLNKYVSEKASSQKIQQIYNEGYTFIYELVNCFGSRRDPFEIFYLNNIVTFFDELNKKIGNNIKR